MTFIPRKAVSLALILFGVFIILFSPVIVCPGLERLLGIETLVGKQNVIYEPDGSYYSTNPGALLHWIVAIASLGISIALTGVLVLIQRKQK